MADWHKDLLRAAGKLHGSIISAIERRIVHLEERFRTFASNASQSDLDTWMAMRTQDDLIAALEDRPSLITSRPRAEVDAIRLLFSAREIAPTDADVLSRVHEVEQAMARKPGLKTVMIEAWHRLLLPRIGELRPEKVFEDVALRRRPQEFALEPTDPGRTFSVTGRRLRELLLSGQVLDQAEALGTSPTG